MTVAFRAPTLADAEAATEVINAHSLRLTGSPDLSVEEIRGWWTQPDVDLAADVVLAELDGKLVGYGDIGVQGADASVLWFDIRGETPAATTALLDELERRAGSRGAPGATLRATTEPADEPLRDALAARGYALSRRSLRMERRLDAPPEAPAWPEGVGVLLAVPGRDEPLLHRLNQDTFRDHWGFVEEPYDGWLHGLTSIGGSDPSLWFVAESDGKPAGLCLARPEAHGDPGLGWVGTLGVLPSARGKGIGAALLLHAFGVFAERGYLRVGLSVDAENTTGAVRLYERAGMEVVHELERWERTL